MRQGRPALPRDPGRDWQAVQVQTRMLRRADNLYFHTVITLSVPSAGPGLWPGMWENSQALRRRTRTGPPSGCGPRPAQGPLASDAACGPTVRSPSHGPNVMIIMIGWPGVPVQPRASHWQVSQWCATGFKFKARASESESDCTVGG
jgi:hypothetical protein